MSGEFEKFKMSCQDDGIIVVSDTTHTSRAATPTPPTTFVPYLEYTTKYTIVGIMRVAID